MLTPTQHLSNTKKKHITQNVQENHEYSRQESDQQKEFYLTTTVVVKYSTSLSNEATIG
jgi:hypothetical protein